MSANIKIILLIIFTLIIVDIYNTEISYGAESIINGSDPNMTSAPNITVTLTPTITPNITTTSTPNTTVTPTITSTPNITSNITPNITVIPTPTITPNITVIPTPTITPNITVISAPIKTPSATHTPKSKQTHTPIRTPTTPIQTPMPTQSVVTGSTPNSSQPGIINSDFYDKVLLAVMLGLIGLIYEIIKIKYEHKAKRESEKSKIDTKDKNERK